MSAFWVSLLIGISIMTTLLCVHFWTQLAMGQRIVSGLRLIRWTNKHIGANDLVLEVGSGHNPHIRSDVLCDKYLSDNTDRAGTIMIDRPFVQCHYPCTLTDLK